MEQDKDQKLKLIWDFRGPDAESIAQHHAIHLKEYIREEKLKLNITGFERAEDKHCIAYMVVYREEFKEVRDALKPHRGQLYKD